MNTHCLKNLPLVLFFFTLLAHSTILQGQKVENELIVQTESPSIMEGISGLEFQEVLSERMGLYRLRFADEARAHKAFTKILPLESVKALHFNQRVQFRDTVPNDQFFPSQWYFGGFTDEEFEMIDGPASWALSRGGVTPQGDSIVVAIIDDGIFRNHPDLQGNMWVNQNEIQGNGIDDDGNGYLDDKNGWNVRDENGSLIEADHGTNVAGIIGASGNNETGIAGANWAVKMLPVTMGQDATVAEVIKSFEYILTQRRAYNTSDGAEGAYIVTANHSFGLRGFTYESAPYWCDFFDTLGQEGIMTVAAAPNTYFDIDEEGDLPTVCPSPYLISVAPINQRGTWTNSGISATHVDLAGFYDESILTTSGEDGYVSPMSSSMYSGFVSGLVGLLYSTDCPDFSAELKENPELVATRIRPLIEEGVQKRVLLRDKTSFGGIVGYFETLRSLVAECDTCLVEDANLFVESLEDDSFLLTLDQSYDSLEWLIREEGVRDWDTLVIENFDSLYLDMGIECENLEVAYTPFCDSVPGLRSQIFSLRNFKDCAFCEQVYCQPENANNKEYFIESISKDTFEFFSGPDLGYGNYSNFRLLPFFTDEKNRIQLSLRKPRIQDEVSIAIWVDSDHSGVFDPREKVVSTVSSQSEVSLRLNLPFTMRTGLTSMRIGLIPGRDLDQLTPCSAHPYSGYFEDYCIDYRILNPECPEIDSIEVLERTATEIQARFHPEPSEDEEAIQARYKLPEDEEWMDLITTGGSFTLPDLEGECTVYDLEVRRICEFDTSSYSQTFEVETQCSDAVDRGKSDAFTVYPNPFEERFSVSLNDSEFGSRSSWILRNPHGKVLMSGNFNHFEQTPVSLNAAQLPAGIYFLEIISGEKKYRQQVIKVR